MTVKLEAKKRTLVGKKVFNLRRAKMIPAVLYGHGTENQNLELDYIPFEKIYREVGESTIIDLAIDGGAPIKALVADVQYDPLKSTFAHIDLRQINMAEKINAHVEIKLVGESKAVKEEGAVLIHNLSEIEIRCLPADLLHEIDVDITSLQVINDVITVGDLKLSDKVEIIGHELEDVVAMVAAPKVEVEEVKPVEPVAGAPAEGAAASPAEASEGKEGKSDKK